MSEEKLPKNDDGKFSSSEKQKVTRRQFLSYTIMGVGGFMAAATVMPMLRFAVDPVLQAKEEGDLVDTKFPVSKITTEPQLVTYEFDQQDGWYESKVKQTAWVYYDDKGELVALSPVCKHLGCTVNWNQKKDEPNRFFCPCHNGLYEKDGTNVPGTPPRGPLDRYEYAIKDGILYLSKRAKKTGGA
jgi:menaquinol-cytochrome c reductase iron-sulfur subunit